MDKGIHSSPFQVIKTIGSYFKRGPKGTQNVTKDRTKSLIHSVLLALRVDTVRIGDLVSISSTFYVQLLCS